MTKLFNIRSYSLKVKLLLILMLPAVGLIYFGGLYLKINLNQYKQTQQMMAFSHYVQQSSTLIHSLQQERGASAGFLASQGKAFIDALSKKRDESDSHLVPFREALAKVDIAGINSRLALTAKANATNLSALPSMREKVDTLSIPVTKSVAFYTRLNQGLIDSFYAMLLTSNSREATSSLLVYNNLANAIDRLGKVRAILSAVFAKGAISPKQVSAVTKLMMQVNVYLENIKSIATEKDYQAFKSILDTPEAKQTKAMIDVALSGAQPQIQAISSKVWFAAITSNINQFVAMETKVNQSITDKLNQELSVAKSNSMFTAAFLIVLCFATLLLSRKIASFILQSVTEAAFYTKEMAGGNLSLDITASSDDEVGQLTGALNTMQTQLGVMISNIQASAAKLTSIADEIKSGNLELSQRTEEQAGSLSQTSSRVTEIADGVSQTASQSVSASELTTNAVTEAEQGGELVKQVMTAMVDINQSSEEIAEIISVIDEIAFQTNLLALNASVEAARAGEQGKGFAVVANEVRELAQRSATSAKEIRNLIQKSTEKVQRGSDLATKSGEAIASIVNSIQSVSDNVTTISRAAADQSSGVNDIRNTLSEIDTLTQHNAAMVEELASSANYVSEYSGKVVDLLAEFKLKK